MKILVKFFSWWKNKYRRGHIVGKIVFIIVNILVIACLISIPVVWSIPGPDTKNARNEWSEITQRINDWNSQLNDLDLELYSELQIADTQNPQPYQEIINTFNDLENDSQRLIQLEASFKGQVIGHTSGTTFKPTKKWQAYLDQLNSNKEQRIQLDEQKREIARERGGLVHTTTIDSLWNERFAITSQIETEQPHLEAAYKTMQDARHSPWGIVKMVYNLIGLGFLIIAGLGVFIAVTERR